MLTKTPSRPVKNILPIDCFLVVNVRHRFIAPLLVGFAMPDSKA